MTDSSRATGAGRPPRASARLACLLLLLLAAGLAAGAAADEPGTARRLAAEGKPGAALTAVEAFLVEHPESVEGRLLRGTLLARLGRTEEAEGLFSELAEAFPELPEPLNNLALIHARRGDYERAAELLEQALRTDARYAAAWENLERSRREQEARAYDRALGHRSPPPEAVDGWRWLDRLEGAVAGLRMVPVPVPVLGSVPAAGDTVEAGGAEPEFDAAGVVALVREWARTWSEGRVEEHLALYASDFVPPRGLSGEAWRAARRERVRSQSRGSVTVESIGVRRLSQRGRAQARFVWVDASLDRSGGVVSTLDLESRDGAWKIVAETAGPP